MVGHLDERTDLMLVCLKAVLSGTLKVAELAEMKDQMLVEN